MLLTKDQVLAAQDRQFETVPVPEWGGELIVAVMDAPARAAYEDYLDGFEEGAKLTGLRGTVVALSCVDAAGERIFTPEDAAALERKSHLALDRVFKVAIRLNKLRKCDVEDMKKNSEPTASGDSCSDSPGTCTAPSENSCTASDSTATS